MLTVESASRSHQEPSNNWLEWRWERSEQACTKAQTNRQVGRSVAADVGPYAPPRVMLYQPTKLRVYTSQIARHQCSIKQLDTMQLLRGEKATRTMVEQRHHQYRTQCPMQRNAFMSYQPKTGRVECVRRRRASVCAWSTLSCAKSRSGASGTLQKMTNEKRDSLDDGKVRPSAQNASSSAEGVPKRWKCTPREKFRQETVYNCINVT